MEATEGGPRKDATSLPLPLARLPPDPLAPDSGGSIHEGG